MQIIQAHTPPYLATVRDLFREYAASLRIDLCFQGFDQELRGLPGKYAPPPGRLLLASDRAPFAGCVALRPIEPGICELKRLYVRPSFRGQGVGRALSVAAINEARRIGYRSVRLDTLAEMVEAISLYDSLGFRRTTPYYHNPSPSAVFMELTLS